MKEVCLVKEENINLLKGIIRRKCTELGWHQVEQSSRVISLAAPREKFHLMTELDSPVVPSLPLQMSIQDEGDDVRAILFPSPRLLTEQAAEGFLSLANDANRELYRGTGLGRFWVDMEHLDFAYEVLLKERLVESDVEEAATQLFDVPLMHFRDLHIPLIMMAGGGWDSATALHYFRQLREAGSVDNSEYGLW